MPSKTVILERRRIPATVVIPAKAGIQTSSNESSLDGFA
jgi:hypothetical protein